MAAHIDFPVTLHELRRTSTPSSGTQSASHLASISGAGPSSGHVASVDHDEDLERITTASVVGREAGERDPLLLRERIVSEDAIDGFKRCANL